jgi:structural maintenance of chromosome 1
VLEFDPSISRVIQFVTNNTFVCETPEDAVYVAFEMEQGKHHNAVSIDGTFYQKSGILSGGSLDVERKTKRWDEKRVSDLKLSREKLTNMLRETLKQCRNESDINVMNLQREGLKTRLKSAESDRERILEQIGDIDAKLRYLTQELTERVGPRIEEVEKRMRSRGAEMQETKERISRVQDEVFADFCRRVGLANIREYEESDELRSLEECARKRLEFEDKKNRITNQIEFARVTRRETNLRNGLQRWQETVNQTERELELAAEVNKREQVEKVEEYDKKQNKLAEIKTEKKSEVDGIEKAAKKARRNVNQLTREGRKAQKELSTATGDLEAKQLVRYDMLKWCKMEGIVIPLLGGDLNEKALSSGLDLRERVARIVVDYSSLPPHLKAVDDAIATEAQLVKTIDDLSATLEKIQISCTYVRTYVQFICTYIEINARFLTS